MTTAEQTIASIDLDKLAAVLAASDPRWRADADPSWSAANSRSIERMAYRVDIHDVPGRATAIRAWAWCDEEDSRWEGEGHSETWHASIREPSARVGGWGGGPRYAVSRTVVHVDFDDVCAE